MQSLLVVISVGISVGIPTDASVPTKKTVYVPHSKHYWIDREKEWNCFRTFSTQNGISLRQVSKLNKDNWVLFHLTHQLAVDLRNEAFSKLQKIWWIASSTKSASKATIIIVCYINECYHIVPFDAHITDVENGKSLAIGLAVHIETMIGITFKFERVLERMTMTNNLNCSSKCFASEIDRRRRSLLLFGSVFLCFHLCLVLWVLSSEFCVLWLCQ